MDPKLTGEFILRLRKNKNLTQAELAEQLGVTDKAVSRWETGKGYPDVVSLAAIGEFFGVSVNELLCGEYLDTDEFKTAADKNITDIIKSKQKSKRRHRIFKALLIILMLFVTGFSGFILIEHCIETQNMKSRLDAPTETVKIDGITTDYKRIDKYDDAYEDIFYHSFEVTELRKKVKNSNLYTISESNDILVNLYAYEHVFQGESAIYVKLEKLKALPHCIDDADVTGFYLCKTGYESGKYIKHFYPLSLSSEQVQNGMNFYNSKKKYELYPDNTALPKEYENKDSLEISQQELYAVYCSVKDIDGMLFNYKYYCILNDDDGKYYLQSSIWPYKNIYEIPDEYQKIIKSALENK